MPESKKFFTEGEQEQVNFSNIPADIKLLIFSFLLLNELGKIASVSKEWNRLSGEDVLWKAFLDPDNLQKISTAKKNNVFTSSAKSLYRTSLLLKKIKNIDYPFISSAQILLDLTEIKLKDYNKKFAEINIKKNVNTFDISKFINIDYSRYQNSCRDLFKDFFKQPKPDYEDGRDPEKDALSPRP